MSDQTCSKECACKTKSIYVHDQGCKCASCTSIAGVGTIFIDPKKRSLIDDEKIFFGYLQALVAGRNHTMNTEQGGAYAIQADILLDEHRRRFPK